MWGAMLVGTGMDGAAPAPKQGGVKGTFLWGWGHICTPTARAEAEATVEIICLR